jgi:hypothetical protein
MLKMRHYIYFYTFIIHLIVKVIIMYMNPQFSDISYKYNHIRILRLCTPSAINEKKTIPARGMLLLLLNIHSIVIYCTDSNLKEYIYIASII